MTRLSSHPGLRANDGLQHEIEIYLRHCGWFYDRRNNHWENDGKPAERVVEIVYLAQAVLAVCLADPASARACRSSLLQADASYYRVFNPQRTFTSEEMRTTLANLRESMATTFRGRTCGW